MGFVKLQSMYIKIVGFIDTSCRLYDICRNCMFPVTYIKLLLYKVTCCCIRLQERLRRIKRNEEKAQLAPPPTKKKKKQETPFNSKVE